MGEGFLCKVSGMSFREYTGDLTTKTVTLELEDDNQWDVKNGTPKDMRAVKVLLNGEHIGYLPIGKEITDVPATRIVRQWIASGKEPKCVPLKCYYTTVTGKATKWNEDGIGKLSGMKLLVYCEDGMIETVDGHIYVRDGQIYYGITSLLEYMPQDRTNLIKWMINNHKTYADYEERMKCAAEAGTAFHRSMERALLMLNGETVSPEDAEVIGNHAMQFLSKLKQAGVQLISRENIAWDDNSHVAGTYDALLRDSHGLHLVDWKTSKSVQDKHLYQVAWYGKVVGAHRASVFCFPRGLPPQSETLNQIQMEPKYSAVCKLADLVRHTGVM